MWDEKISEIPPKLSRGSQVFLCAAHGHRARPCEHCTALLDPQGFISTFHAATGAAVLSPPPAILVNTPELIKHQHHTPCTGRQPWDLHPSKIHTQTSWRLFHTRLFIHGTSPFTLQIQKPTHSCEKNKSWVPRLSIYNGSSFSAVAFALSSDTHEAFNLEPTKLQNHLRVLTRLCSVLLTGTNSRISV